MREVYVLVSAFPFEPDGVRCASLVLEDLSQVIASSAVVPMCMHCKKVRQDGLWRGMESYLSDTIDLNVSHSICPNCMRTLYPELADPMPQGD